MEIAGYMDVYASGALYGDCGGTKKFVLVAHRSCVCFMLELGLHSRSAMYCVSGETDGQE
ncbi:hypothetical protein F2Q70_00004054 [Brassica cretica]|uniref:Uncharacterized protein n=1 Tax=Brassica cretica TaxID=69181 RepID=A0A3N6RBQ0_BRACR|nr:hypothetical protein F2Q70_00004054 [Brassica cretica]KAF3567506.1 hypothetical protein DY000_02015992 [Brassica cretica]